MKDIKGKRIFISGGAGVIGKEIVPKLVKLGAILYVGDLKPCPDNFSSIVKYRQGDLNYISKEELEQFSPQVFIHLAATFERSTESYEFWHENFWHNVHLSNHLMTMVKDIASIEKVVFASSYLIYDPVLYNFDSPRESAVLLKETDPVYPRNLTGMAKFSHEIELRFLENFKHENYKIICARIYRGYGKNSRDIISRWIRSLLNNDEITIYRKEGIFDYIYSADTAEGLIHLAFSDSAEGIINLGTGKPRKVADIISILRNYFPDLKSREMDSDILYEASGADITKLKQFCNWEPEYQLEKSIPEMIEFEKNKKKEKENFDFNFLNILVTSSSKKVPLLEAVKTAAKKISSTIKVFAGDMNDQAITKYFADGFWVMPPVKDEFLLEIINYCKANNIRIIIPSRDGELLFWAKNKKTLIESGINVMISDENSVRFCLDKLEFAEKCIKEKVNAIPASLDMKNIEADTFVVKERWGAGSLNIGINLDRKSAAEHSKKLEEVIYQPFVTGYEISVDVYLDKNNKLKGYILRKRDQVVNGESQITTTFQNPKIGAEVEKFFKIFKLSGHVILQGIVDKNENINWIECNCRFGGASTLAIRSGLDSFYWFILESSGTDITDYYFESNQCRIKQIRVPFDFYKTES